jgi:hypothetical protein
MTRINKILLTASFLALFPLGLIGPIYAIFVKKIGGDILEAGISYGFFLLTSGIFIITIGNSTFFKNHLRQMVFLGYLILTIGEAGYLLVQNPMHLFIVQVVIGIAGGILEPSWDGLFSAKLDEKKAASSWAIWAGGRDIISGIGAFTGAILVVAYSFQLMFIVMLVFNLMATAVSFKLLSLPENTAAAGEAQNKNKL